MKYWWKWVLLFLAALLLYYSAVLYVSNALLYLAVLAFFLAPFEAALLFYQSRHMKLSLTCITREIRKGEPVILFVELQNNSVLPCRSAAISCLEHSTGQRAQAVAYVPQRSSVKLKITFQPDRIGKLRINAESLQLSGMLGLFRKKLSCRDKEEVIYSFPVRQQIKTAVSEAMPTEEVEESTESNKKGIRRDNLLGVREFVPGDTLKQIHWKLSARQGDFYVKEYSEDLRFEHVILVDVSGLCQEDEQHLQEGYNQLAGVSYDLIRKNVIHQIVICRKTKTSYDMQCFSVTEEKQLLTLFVTLFEAVEEELKRKEEITEQSSSKEGILTAYQMQYQTVREECVTYLC